MQRQDKCEIEDWGHTYTAVMQALTIGGVATCDTGVARLRLYDGEGDGRKFLTVDTSYIQGHIFKTVMFNIERPPTLSIKYSIEPN